MQPDYAPRGLGRILDRAFEMYRANFRTVVVSSLIVLFPVAMLVGVTQVFSTRGLLQIFGTLSQAGDLDAFNEALNGIQALSVLSNAVTPLYFAARVYLASCLLSMAPAMLVGQRPGVREFLKAGRRRFLWLLLTMVAVSASVSISVFLIVVPILLWVRLSVAHVACVVEEAPIDQAFKRSWGLTRTFFWRTIGFAIVLSVISLVLQAAIDSPAVVRQIVASVNNPESLFQELSPGWKTFEGVLTALATALIQPFLELSWFSYYLDLRARGEGLDLVAKAGALASRSRTTA